MLGRDAQCQIPARLARLVLARPGARDIAAETLGDRRRLTRCRGEVLHLDAHLPRTDQLAALDRRSLLRPGGSPGGLRLLRRGRRVPGEKPFRGSRREAAAGVERPLAASPVSGGGRGAQGENDQSEGEVSFHRRLPLPSTKDTAEE